MRSARVALALDALLPGCLPAAAQAPRFEIGTPVLTDLWVDGTAGSNVFRCERCEHVLLA